MITIQTESMLGDLIRDNPRLAPVLEELNIDYCCKGRRTLAEASQQRGIDPGMVLNRLREADAATAPEREKNVSSFSQDELVDHILATHHAYVAREIPRLRSLAHRVARAHGEKDPRLLALERVFGGLGEELLAHMMKEEQILFPMIRALANGEEAGIFCGGPEGPIRQMRHEHDEAGLALEEMRGLTDDFASPEWACPTYRALMAGLAEFTRDLHLHVHKENNILFPRAAFAEKVS